MFHSSLKPERLASQNLLGSLRIFVSKKREILLVFVFGSLVSKRMHRSSDVDIGILFKGDPRIDAVNDLTEKLSSTLQKEVDLTVLNQASPVLKMQILKHKILLYASNRKYFHQFFTDTVNQYADLKQVRETCEESILKGRIYAR